MNSLKNIPSISAVLLLVACASPQPNPTQEEVVEQALPETTDIAAEWGTVLQQGGVADGWLKSFQDEQLEAIVEEALKHNRDIAALSSNLTIAANLARQAGANLLPAVNVGGAATSTSRGGNDTDSSGAALNLSWELDLWGKLASAAEAAEQAYQATEADFEFARQSLVAQTAKAWFMSTEANRQKQLADEAVAIYTEMLEIAQTRLEVGAAQPQDVFLARSELSSATERQRQAGGALDQSIRSLEILLGRYPANELETPRKFIPVPPPVPAGVPGDILSRRPDLQAAESRVNAAFQQVQVAKAAKLPSIGLTASGGGSSNALTDLLGSGSDFFSLGANFFAPIDVGGQLQAQVEIETAEQDAALANYGGMALRAFGEVENALSNEVILKQRQELLEFAVEDSMKAYDIAKTQYEVGAIGVLDVLQMQARTLNSRIALVRLKNQRLAQRIDLHLALGGSFESDQ